MKIDKNQACLILENLKEYLLGQDLMEIEKLFDQMLINLINIKYIFIQGECKPWNTKNLEINM